MKRSIKYSFLALAVVLFSTACASFKTTESYSQVRDDGGMTRTQYIMIMEKDGQDYLEIAEVKLRDSRSKEVRTVSFAVMDAQRQNTILNLKGYSAFSIVATLTDPGFEPNQAIVMYRTKVEGDLKSKKVKPLIREDK